MSDTTQTDRHKIALLEALGMDRTRDWDDMANAARCILAERNTLRAAADANRGRKHARFGIAPIFIDMGGDMVRIGWKFHVRRGGRWHFWLTDNATARAIAKHKAGRSS